MNTATAKAYVNKRFEELTKVYPTRSKIVIVNVIIQELRQTHNFSLTLYTGQSIIGITEDAKGIIYHV